jgi:hypothetical protein
LDRKSAAVGLECCEKIDGDFGLVDFVESRQREVALVKAHLFSDGDVLGHNRKYLLGDHSANGVVLDASHRPPLVGVPIALDLKLLHAVEDLLLVHCLDLLLDSAV